MSRFFCRKCNYQFEDFDWDSVERENIYSDSLNDQFRETESYLHNNLFNVSLKDGLKFILWTILCVYGIYYGLNNSLWCYYLSSISYLMLINFKYYKLFFKIFKISIEEKIGNKIFYNYRLESFRLISGEILVLIIFLPINKFIGNGNYIIGHTAIIFSFFIIALGLDFFIRSDVFNTYNDYYVVTVYLMFLMPATVVMG